MNEENGNGHPTTNGSKIFDLAPKQDPLLAQIVPAARRKICLNTNISESARMFFCYLTDCSLLPGTNTRKGVVKFSDMDLAVRFKVNPKTIRNWKREVESTGEIWITQRWSKNSFPQTVYNVTAIVGQATLPLNTESEDGSLPDDEVFSSNRRRQMTAKRNDGGKFTCRIHGRSGCEICRRATPPGVPAPVQAETAVEISSKRTPEEKILPPTTAIDCRPPRQLIAADRGNRLPSPTAKYCRPARQKIAAARGNKLPRPAANGFRSPRQTVADNGKTELERKSLSEIGEEATPTDRAWLKSLEGQFPSHLRALETKIKARLENARSDAARAGLKRQLKAVQERLLPSVPDDPQDAPKPKPARKATAPAMPTEAEILEGARYLVSVGKESTLTEPMRAALQRAGELVTK